MKNPAANTARRLVLLSLLAVALSGCFGSKKELISSKEAEFPFEEISFSEVGRNEPTILVLRDGAYRSLEEDNPVAFLFKKIAPDTYVTQAMGEEGGKKSYLFAVLKVDGRTNLIRAYKAEAKDEEKAPGLYRCMDDTLCFDTLQPYVDYALKAIAAGEEPDATYRILSTKPVTPR